MDDRYFYLSHILRLLTTTHSIVALCMLLAYYHLKVNGGFSILIDFNMLMLGTLGGKDEVGGCVGLLVFGICFGIQMLEAEGEH